MSETKAFNLLRLALIFGGTSAISYDVSYHHIPQGRIIDGLEAHPGQFPFMAALEITKQNGKEFCGGSLILPEWILTAAHCLHTAQFALIYLGATYRKEPEIGYAVWHTDCFIHPSYSPSRSRFDIALIRTPRTNFCDNMRSIPLPNVNSQTNYVGEIAIVSGWGRKCSDIAGPSKCLQWTKVQIVSNAVCKETDRFAHSSEICLSVEIQGIPWNGDSGDPVFLESTGELIGVFTRSIAEMAEERKPVMAASVVDSFPWIKTVTGIP